MTEWTKIDEQCVGGIGYEDFISSDSKRVKRVWYDGEIEFYDIAEQAPLWGTLYFICLTDKNSKRKNEIIAKNLLTNATDYVIL